MKKVIYLIIILNIIVGLTACKKDNAGKGIVERPLFELLKEDRTQLHFQNEVHQDTSFNVFNYMYFFNGGGVSVGDFNNDELPDIYLTNNMGDNKLFLNEGDFKFKDVTEQAGVTGQKGWTSGVTVVDINNDGLLDLYVSQIGKYEILEGSNQLFVCQGIENGVPTYKNEAAQYKLDLVGFSTQAAFFDYDLDGDLDMFQLNHSLHQNGTFGRKDKFEGVKNELAGDKLFRNDGAKGFTEVTTQAGIKSNVIGYGLGLVTGDLNEDGWVDIYIGNDFHEDDYMYINQQDGTFKEVRKDQLMHTSRFSMGVDIADINNDGLNDIFTLDMQPEDPYILKTSLGEDGYNKFKMKLGFGYFHQYARNNLQINQGNGTFSEIGMYSDVYASDWSWSTLLFDFDNDGNKDIFVSNGIPRRMNDIDYINFREADPNMNFKTNNNVLTEDEMIEVIEEMPKIKIPNKFYRNDGQLNFKDSKAAITGDENSFSNGAAYADFDNDGDLDIVVNNLFDAPFLYKNLNTENKTTATKNDAIIVKLKGTANNINAIGSKLIAIKENKTLVAELFPTRGYQSSVDLDLHLGVGNKDEIQKIYLVWADQTYQEIEPKFNQKMNIEWQADLPKFDFSILKKQQTQSFEDITASLGLAHLHVENPFVEFNREQLIPHMTSSEGPAIAVGDLNGDGLEDFFIGSAKRERSAVYFQTTAGKFENRTPISIVQDSLFEDIDAKIVDIDNDKDLDIVIATGGNEYKGKEDALTQRIYINEGNEKFTKITLPSIHITAACVLPADFNGDGLVDLFYGGRTIPWNYGVIPNSYLLENQGNGKFKQVQSKELQKVGLVKDGNWSDIDGDGDLDLILAMEWDAITIFINNNGKFTEQKINEDKGWWNFALPYDFDGDGDIDILAGNLGENAKLKPTKDEPLRLYVNDFDDNKQIEQVLTYYLGGNEIPFANHRELTSQLVSLKKKYMLAKDFANASIEELFGKKKLKNSTIWIANMMKSVYYENTGDMNFKAHVLPSELQWSTLESAKIGDFNNDGKTDVMLGSNFYDCNIEMGRYDSHYGNILSFDKNGQMEVSPIGSLRIKGQVRRIASIKIGNETAYILAKNNDYLQVIK